MCSITAALVASTALSIASAGAGYMQETEQANAQAEYQAKVAAESRRAAEQNAKVAEESYHEQAAAQSIQYMQQQEQTAQNVQDLQKERMQKVGTAVASSESAGMSFQNLIADFYRQEANYRNNYNRNMEYNKTAFETNVNGLRRTAKNQSASFQNYIPSNIQGPSLLGTGLSIGGSIAQGAFDYYTLQKKYSA